MGRKPLLILLIWLMTGSSAAALDLKPGQPVRHLLPDLVFLADSGLTLKETIEAYEAGRFKSDPAILRGADTLQDPIWLAVELANRSVDDGRPDDEWILASGLTLMLNFEVYLVRKNGLTEFLLQWNLNKPFSSETNSLAGLVSDRIALAPGETALLLIYWQPFYERSVWVGLETDASLNQRQILSGVGYAAFYGFSAGCLLLFAGFCLSMGNRTGLLLAGAFLTALFQLAELDGLLFRYLWPDSPQINFRASDLFTLIMSSVGLFVAGRLMAGHGWKNKVSRIVTIMSVIPLVLIPFAGRDVTLLSQILYTLMLIAVLVVAAIWRTAAGRVFLLADILAALAVAAMVVQVIAVNTGSGQQLVPILMIAKLIYILVVLSAMIGLTSHIIRLRRDHQAAHERAREALAQDAERARALLEAEKNYSRARDLAHLRQTQLATASHDLKQPLASLRMTMDTIANDGAPDVKARLREAFDYMEGLTAGYLAETRPDPDMDDLAGADRSAAQQADLEDTQAVEPYDISLVLRAVRQMFSEEAVSKGLRLRMVDSSVQVTVPPLVMMRIVSTLVANAVSHTEEGTVLFGVRRCSAAVRVEIHDTGPGLSAGQLSDLMQAGQNGEPSGGERTGLAICVELAGKHGLELNARSEPGRGTCFALHVPGR